MDLQGSKVQFVQGSDKQEHVAVLTASGVIVTLVALETTSRGGVDPASEVGEVVVGGGRFDGLILFCFSFYGSLIFKSGILNTVHAAVPASVGEEKDLLRGNNNVGFSRTFLPDTATHVLPPASVMLTSLLKGLLAKGSEKQTAAAPTADEPSLPVELGVIMGGADVGGGEKNEDENLPHHFGTEARDAIAAAFK